MAINQNHTAEEIDGVKCAVVEKNASQERLDFLKPLLEFNGFTVVVAPSPPPKAAAPPAVPAASTPESAETPKPPEASAVPAGPLTFTIGVTDVAFNPTNAIFGRLLKTKDGKVVTLAYWQQKEKVSEDTIPYFKK